MHPHVQERDQEISELEVAPSAALCRVDVFRLILHGLLSAHVCT